MDHSLSSTWEADLVLEFTNLEGPDLEGDPAIQQLRRALLTYGRWSWACCR
jgi:hypothetical protein